MTLTRLTPEAPFRAPERPLSCRRGARQGTVAATSRGSPRWNHRMPMPETPPVPQTTPSAASAGRSPYAGRLVVVIPAYNEGERVAKVIGDVARELPDVEVL